MEDVGIKERGRKSIGVGVQCCHNDTIMTHRAINDSNCRATPMSFLMRYLVSTSFKKS